MAYALIRGINIRYEVVGDAGPWLVLTPGGRRGHDEFMTLAEKIAARGFRVLLWDRRNTGASEIEISGEKLSEEEIWTDDLHELLTQLDALPAFIGGSSSGARTSILFYLRHPQAVRGLLLFRVTGGEFAAGRLGNNYYGQFIEAARSGGMAAVCEMDRWKGIIAANPVNRERLMAIDPKDFIRVMTHWRGHLEKGILLPIAGVSAAQLGSIAVPTIIIPGNDGVHDGSRGRLAHQLIPGSQLHELPIEDSGLPYIPFEDWAPHEQEIADTFVEFMEKELAAS